ncbi:MAG: hypothetical protein ACHQVS_03700 [Candidatus Babeliales bacterium]
MNRYQCSVVIGVVLISAMAIGNSSAVDERVLKHNLDEAVRFVKKSDASTENSLEQLLCVLEAELTLVEYLQTDVTGTRVEDAVHEREQRLAESVPSVVYLYNLIMDFATYNPLLTADNTYLNYHERAAYFNCILTTLEQYYHEFQTMQHRASLAYRLQSHTT